MSASLALVAMLHGDALFHGFVHDDQALLEGSHRLADLSTLPTALTHDLFWLADGAVRPSPYWRPLVVLSYYLDRAIGGGAAWTFHATNLVLLALLGWLALRGVEGRWRRLGVLLLCLGHPMQVEVAQNITARTDLLAAIFGVLAARRAGLAGAGLTLLALLSKEVALVVPLVAALAATAEGDGRRGRWLPHALVALGWLAVRGALVAGFGVAPEDRGLPTLDGTLEAPARVLFYLGRLLWPLHPVAARALPEPGLPLIILGWAIVAGMGLALARALRDRRPLAGDLATLLLPLLPVSGLMASPVRYAEGFLCWPVFGLSRLLSRIAPPQALVALALPCVALSAAAVPAWRDEAHLWQAARAAYPDDPLVAGKYGRAMLSLDPAASRAALSQALAGETDPRRLRELHAALGRLDLDAGDWRAAVPHLRIAARPDDVEATWALAARCQAEAGERLPADAEIPSLREVCAEAARRVPDDPGLWDAVGVEAVSRGDLDAAGRAFDAALALAPDRAQTRQNRRALQELRAGSAGQPPP